MQEFSLQLWDIYQKVVAADYMFHREIGADVRRELRARIAGQPFWFLDLGCGDAATLVPVLEGLAVARYKGVDLSETALALANKNLATLPCTVELIHGDLSTTLTEDTASYDVIYSSFALHHLPTHEKADFFHRAAQHLDGAALLLLVDVVRKEDESLQAYLSHYCDWLRSSWTSLDTHEMDLACDHVVNNDLPEPFTVLQAQALAAGFGKTRQVACYNWHQVLCVTRA
jgi:cyclopropane fatty-acyl-phospholipid synthase-like methyltransferase